MKALVILALLLTGCTTVIQVQPTAPPATNESTPTPAAATSIGATAGPAVPTSAAATIPMTYLRNTITTAIDELDSYATDFKAGKGAANLLTAYMNFASRRNS